MENEVWKPVVGYEGWYSVSSLGRIRREKAWRGTQAGRILKNSKDEKGYPQIRLNKQGVGRTFKIHILVAMAFLGSRPSGLVLDHIDANPLNNCPTNLEYVTQKENMRRAAVMGRIPPQCGEKHGMSKVTEEQVLKIRRMRSEGLTLKYIGAQVGLGTSQIHRITRKEAWPHIT